MGNSNCRSFVSPRKKPLPVSVRIVQCYNCCRPQHIVQSLEDNWSLTIRGHQNFIGRLDRTPPDTEINYAGRAIVARRTADIVAASRRPDHGVTSVLRKQAQLLWPLKSIALRLQQRLLQGDWLGSPRSSSRDAVPEQTRTGKPTRYAALAVSASCPHHNLLSRLHLLGQSDGLLGLHCHARISEGLPCKTYPL